MRLAVEPRPELYKAGGVLALDVPTYVAREADDEFFEALKRREYCYVLTPRQMGKSSLIVRTRDRLASVGISSVFIDITGLDSDPQDVWYREQADEIAGALELPSNYVEWWEKQSRLGPVKRFARFLAEVVMEHVSSEVVIFLDEIDSTIGLPYSDDYFAAIRSLYNQRPFDERLKRLTFALLGVASPTDLIKGRKRTPFNIGKRIDLTDFTWNEAKPLLKGLAPDPDLAEKLLERILFWTGGHPYLSQRACQDVAEWARADWNPSLVPEIVDRKIQERFLSDAVRPTDSNLQFVTDRIAGRAGEPLSDSAREQLNIYREVLRGARIPDEELDPAKAALKLSGLVVPGAAGLRVRNRIYETVFNETWVRGILGEPEVRTNGQATYRYDVFVSYAHGDREWVAGYLIPHLKKTNLRVAVDLDLKPGAVWAEELKLMAETSEFFVPVLSPEWADSRGAQEEFALMSNRVGKIVPVLLKPTRLPPFLAGIAYADFRNPEEWPERIQSLCEVLGAGRTVAKGNKRQPEQGRKSKKSTRPPASVEKALQPSGTDSLAGEASSWSASEWWDRQSLSQMADAAGRLLSRDALLKLVKDFSPEALAQVSGVTTTGELVGILLKKASQSVRSSDLSTAIRKALTRATPQPIMEALPLRPSPLESSRGYHAFVAMPFGLKASPDGTVINCDAVYQTLIRPALESAGFEVFRADENRSAGDIRSDMFQELLFADLVVADLSLDDPNVWYELGVRHALRARSVIQIQALRSYTPFDVYVDRALRCHLKGGVPDPEQLEADRNALAEFARETAKDWRNRKVSPVYHLLGQLKEPDWRALRIEEAKEFWAAQDAWQRRVEVACRRLRPGDILSLAPEAPSRRLRMEAYYAAAQAFQSLGQYKLALEQCENALEIDPDNLKNRIQGALLLSRLGNQEEARVWLGAILKEHPEDPKTWRMLGRIEKEAWIECWRQPGASREQMRHDAAGGAELLRRAIDAYSTGFVREPTKVHPGIWAFTLLHLLTHLTGDLFAVERSRELEGGIRWIAASMLQQNPTDYGARANLADLAIVTGSVAAVRQASEEAVAAAGNDWSILDKSRQRILLLADVGFRPKAVSAALNIFNRVLQQLHPPEVPEHPQHVVLFSGHMIDAPDRKTPRFPADCEPIALKRIEEVLERIGVGSGDIGMCGGASGGDILFAEACLRRGMRIEIRIPAEESAFIRRSVTPAGNAWLDRFYTLKRDPNSNLYVMPEEIGAAPRDANIYERNNLWLLNSALTWGEDRLSFVCLWDGQAGDGPGGTADMIEQVRRRSGRVYHIDTRKAFRHA